MSIKVEGNDSIEVVKSDTVIAKDTSTTIVLDEIPKVKAHPRDYKIVGTDVVLIRRNSDPDQWFKDIMNNQIESSTLAQDVGDLEDRFRQFNDGVTLEIGYLRDQDEVTAFNLSTVKASNDVNTAGIQNLEQTRVTEEGAYAISEATIAAWSIGQGAAWFNDRVSTVANVAYSAAKSASTLTASLDNQQDQLNQAFADIEILEKQVDGKVETWFGTATPVDGNGFIDPVVEPYATWVSTNEEVIHTGDTYVHYELDANNNKVILATYRFVKDPDTDLFSWVIFEDDLASTAYQRALSAEEVADSKIITWYQTFPPTYTTQEQKDNALGDIWLDSSDNNNMYRWNGTQWEEVADTRVQASVTRLDQSTVTVGGQARAKSSLVVDANGSVSGFVADSGTTSTFKIFADKFSIANTSGYSIGNPFEIDTETNKIAFTGSVTFKGTPVETAVQPYTVQQAIQDNVTAIDGAKIVTGSINANKITANTSMASPIINSGTLNSNTINGGTINGTTMNAVTINTGTLNADMIVSGSLTNTSVASFNSFATGSDIQLATIYASNSGGQAELISVSITINGVSREVGGSLILKKNGTPVAAGGIILTRRDVLPGHGNYAHYYVGNLSYTSLASNSVYTLHSNLTSVSWAPYSGIMTLTRLRK